MSDRRLPELAVGTGLVALALIAGALDLGIGIENWDSYTPVGPSDPLPEFAVRLDDGSTLRSEDLEGQVSLLTFWATWCGPCRLEMPVLRAVDDRYGDELQIYGVNRDSGPMPERRAKVEAFTDERDLGFPQIYDNGEMAGAFEIGGIPHMVVVDRDAKIRHVHLGRVSERDLRKEIDALLDE